MSDFSLERGDEQVNRLRELGGAELVGIDRLSLVWDTAGECAALVDRIFPDQTPVAPVEAPISDGTVARVADYARAASEKSQADQAEVVASHQVDVDRFAVSGQDLMSQAGYAPAPETAIPSAGDTLTAIREDVQSALDARYGMN